MFGKSLPFLVLGVALLASPMMMQPADAATSFKIACSTNDCRSAPPPNNPLKPDDGNTQKIACDDGRCNRSGGNGGKYGPDEQDKQLRLSQNKPPCDGASCDLHLSGDEGQDCRRPIGLM